LGIPTVRDRVVQAAIVNVIEPIFERDFAEHRSPRSSKRKSWKTPSSGFSLGWIPH
jgi:retron-type reverse transcriptase